MPAQVFNHLSDALAAVNNNFVAICTSQGVTLDVPPGIGGELINQEQLYPRLVWRYTKDQFEGAVDNKGLRSGQTGGRSLITKAAGAEAYIWGATYELAEDLTTYLIQAIRQAVAASNAACAIEGGEWHTDNFATAGRAYILRVSFKLPVQDTGWTTATVTGIPQTNTMTFLDGTSQNT